MRYSPSAALRILAPRARRKVIRRNGDKNEEIKVKLDKVLEKGEMKFNIPLRAGDVVVVPESRF